MDQIPREVLLSEVQLINGEYGVTLDKTDFVKGEYTLEFYSAADDKLVVSRTINYDAASYEAQDFKLPFGRYYLKIKDNNNIYRLLPCPINHISKIKLFDVNSEEKTTGFVLILIEKPE